MGVLEFLPAPRRLLRLLASEPEKFAEEHGVRLHPVAQSVAQTSLEFMRTFSLETPSHWFGYFVIEGASQQLVGVCSFKGPPADGALEMAYYTFPGFERRGIGTEMARFLLQRARELPGVKALIVRASPDQRTAMRILEKIGMRFAGQEEEDGATVWRWEISFE